LGYKNHHHHHHRAEVIDGFRVAGVALFPMSVGKLKTNLIAIQITHIEAVPHLAKKWPTYGFLLFYTLKNKNYNYTN